MLIELHRNHPTMTGVEHIEVRYFFKQGEMVRYGIMAGKYENGSRKEHVF